MSTYGWAQHAGIFALAGSAHLPFAARDRVENVARGVSPRSRQYPRALLAPLFRVWFSARTQAQTEWRYPAEPAEVSVDGIDPARILMIGDGLVAGCGVRTHHLGIAGYLARHIARQLNRGVVVTVIASPTASAHSTLKRLGEVDVDGYDSIIVMLAATDALCLTSRRTWRRDMTGLVRAVTSASTASVFVTSTAHLGVARSLTPFPRAVTSDHARMLDIQTRQICAESSTTMISLDAASELTSRTYAKWGRRIGAQVAGSLRAADAASILRM